jgi:hypothetical protein
MPINHRKVSAKPDGPDTTLIRPSDWNDSIIVSGGTNGQVLTRDSAQTDGWQWVAAPGLPASVASLDIGNLDVTQTLELSGVLTPPQITANQNNYAPTGLPTSTVLRLSTSAALSLTGLQAGGSGRTLYLHNIGANDLVLVNDSASSTAANRFALGSDLTITTNRVAVLQYDLLSARWRAVSGSGGGGGAGAPGGPTAAVQFNDGGVLNGEAALTYDKLNDNVIASNVRVTGTLEVTGAGGGFTEYTTASMALSVANSVRVGAQLGNVLAISANGGPITSLVCLAGDLTGTQPLPVVHRLSTTAALTGIVTAAQLTADQHDYNPPNLPAASTLRLSSDAARSITGLAGGFNGRLMILHNVGLNNIVLSNQDALSLFQNRFRFAASMTLAGFQSIMLQYDATSQWWRAVGAPA